MMTGHEVGAALGVAILTAVSGDLTTRAGLVVAYPRAFEAVLVILGALLVLTLIAVPNGKGSDADHAARTTDTRSKGLSAAELRLTNPRESLGSKGHRPPQRHRHSPRQQTTAGWAGFASLSTVRPGIVGAGCPHHRRTCDHHPGPSGPGKTDGRCRAREIGMGSWGR